MSSPGSPGAAAWRLEAEAVSADIAPHVTSAAVSSLGAGSAGAFLNITTLEGRRLTVRLSGAGFSICGDGHDSSAAGETSSSGHGRVYETPYALLHEVSPGYTAAFGASLAARLGQLAADGAESGEEVGDEGQGEGKDSGRIGGVDGEEAERAPGGERSTTLDPQETT